jgi:hypothetical protein
LQFGHLDDRSQGQAIACVIAKELDNDFSISAGFSNMVEKWTVRYESIDQGGYFIGKPLIL